MHWLDRAAAVMFIGFGLGLAASDHSPRSSTGG
jgi:threonine/homoserine/homoserine lactone efflux protein